MAKIVEAVGICSVGSTPGPHPGSVEVASTPGVQWPPIHGVPLEYTPWNQSPLEKNAPKSSYLLV